MDNVTIPDNFAIELPAYSRNISGFTMLQIILLDSFPESDITIDYWGLSDSINKETCINTRTCKLNIQEQTLKDGHIWAVINTHILHMPAITIHLRIHQGMCNVSHKQHYIARIYWLCRFTNHAPLPVAFHVIYTVHNIFEIMIGPQYCVHFKYFLKWLNTDQLLT